MTEEAIERLLANRDSLISFVEPWRGTGPDGNPVGCHAMISMTVQDAINYSRTRYSAQYDDRTIFEEFLVVHWAFEQTAQ